MRAALLLAALTTTATAQWTLQPAPTTADLRGIDNVGHGVAWASGTSGTVLRTTDNGTTWLRCPTPPKAEALDFRGIQAFDAQTAIVMSSGKGDLSRLYKTTDACKTWKLLFTNPDKDGFWDAVQFESQDHGVLLGDPVNGSFVLLATFNGGESWVRSNAIGLKAVSREAGAFAASNSSLHVLFPIPSFVTGGPPNAFFYAGDMLCDEGAAANDIEVCFKTQVTYQSEILPMNGSNSSSGAFATAGDPVHPPHATVIVGGDYTKPDLRTGTAVWVDFHVGGGWHAATTPPHGYRSAVAYDAPTRTWITVGPNGTDISTDDGRNWHPLKPSPTDQPDADQHWNALSLPFVVGPHGHIGILNPSALKP